MLSMGCTSGKENVVLKNRKRTLKRKASELSTLCGAEVCMVFMDANGNLEVWPEDADKAYATFIKYNSIIQSQPAKKPKKTTRSGRAAGFDDDGFEIIPSCCFDTNNPDLIPNSNCNMGMVHQFDQFQPSLPLATTTDFSERDRATMAASSGSESESPSNNYNNIIDDDEHDNQITCVGPIVGFDDEFEIIPGGCFDEFDMNNPDDLITNNRNTVMVDQLDQFQPSLPLATMDFSDRDRAAMASSSEFSDGATMAASSGSESELLSNNYINIIDDDEHDDRITCVGPIDGFDDEFEIIPGCCFDEFGMDNSDDLIANNCKTVMVDQLDQFQPSLPLVTMDFSVRDRATMAASSEFSDGATMAASSGSESESLSNNYNTIIDYATWDYFTDEVGNTISFDDDPSDQYWNNLFGEAGVDTGSDLGSDLFYFLMEDKEGNL